MKKTVWEIRMGDKVKKITISDIYETFMSAISVMNKEMKFNKVIKDSPKLREKYEFYVALLKLIRDKFMYAGEEEQQKVKLKTAKGRK